MINIPFLPAMEKDRMTLVLDLDETLVHFFYVNFCFQNLIFLYKIYLFEFNK